MLIIAARGAVATVVRILLQTVDAIVGGHCGGIADKTGAARIVLLGQQHLLAPVADDVAHEGRARASGGVGGPVAFL